MPLGSDRLVLPVTTQRLRDDFDGIVAFVAELRAALHRRQRTST